MVEIAALPQKPQRVARADPVVAVILAVAVAGHDLVPLREDPVHLLYVIRLEHVVRVKDEIAVEALREIPLQM